MNSIFIWSRALLLLALAFLPPILVLSATVRARKSKQFHAFLFLIGIAAIVNWALFVSYALTDIYHGAAYHFRISDLAPALLMLTLVFVALSVKVHAQRSMLVTSNLILLALWFVFAYSPQHWFGRSWMGSASIGDNKIPAVVYVANPRESEAESIALVRVPNVGDYFIDLGDEKFRDASKSELLPLHYGVWTWKAAPNGGFHQPLPYLQVNQCRIRVADGRVLSIDF